MLPALIVSMVLAQGSSTMAGPGPSILRSSSGPADFFTYSLSAPSAGAQCTDAAITSDQSDAITCTRASTAYCTKADGTMVSHAVDRCRVESAGLLWEKAATNLALRSMELDSAPWASFAVTIDSVNSGTFPDGNATMELLTSTATNGAHYQEVTVSGTGPWTGSVYGSKTSGTGPISVMIYCLTGGTVASCACDREDGSACSTDTASLSGMCIAYSTVGTVADRLSVTATCTNAQTSVYFSMAPGQRYASTGTAYMGGAQFVTGSIATSYIPTVGTAVTRAVDSITTTLARSIDTAGCVAASVTYRPFTTGSSFWLTDIGYLSAASATSLALTDGTNTATATVASMANTTTTARSYWSGATLGVESGGASDTDPFGGTMTTDNILYLGDNLNGHIRAVRANTDPDGCQ